MVELLGLLVRLKEDCIQNIYNPRILLVDYIRVPHLKISFQGRISGTIPGGQDDARFISIMAEVANMNVCISN